MTPVFLHGWGFDAGLWTRLAGALGGVLLGRGYFGPARQTWPEGPVLAIGHSLGSLLLLRDALPRVRALVAINGFDRFAGADDWPGIPPRIIDRMVDRFDAEPQTVLDAFRARCGASPAPPIADAARLAADLRLLRDADERAASRRWRRPLLVLHGGADPLLPPALRDRAFGDAPAVSRFTCEAGGHLLPTTHPDWCFDRIRAFAAILA